MWIVDSTGTEPGKKKNISTEKDVKIANEPIVITSPTRHRRF